MNYTRKSSFSKPPVKSGSQRGVSTSYCNLFDMSVKNGHVHIIDIFSFYCYNIIIRSCRTYDQLEGIMPRPTNPQKRRARCERAAQRESREQQSLCKSCKKPREACEAQFPNYKHHRFEPMSRAEQADYLDLVELNERVQAELPPQHFANHNPLSCPMPARICHAADGISVQSR